MKTKCRLSLFLLTFFSVAPHHAHLREEATRLLKYQLDHNEDLLPVLNAILLDFDYTDLSSTYRVVGQGSYPVHVINGGKDPITRPEGLNLIKEWIKRAETTLLPTLGHNTYYEDPSTFLSLTLPFFAKASK
jgi:pimeloyl-ACP methyl ester carboxylesterase